MYAYLGELRRDSSRAHAHRRATQRNSFQTASKTRAHIGLAKSTRSEPYVVRVRNACSLRTCTLTPAFTIARARLQTTLAHGYNLLRHNNTLLT